VATRARACAPRNARTNTNPHQNGTDADHNPSHPTIPLIATLPKQQGARLDGVDRGAQRVVHRVCVAVDRHVVRAEKAVQQRPVRRQRAQHAQRLHALPRGPAGRAAAGGGAGRGGLVRRQTAGRRGGGGKSAGGCPGRAPGRGRGRRSPVAVGRAPGQHALEQRRRRVGREEGVAPQHGAGAAQRGAALGGGRRVRLWVERRPAGRQQAGADLCSWARASAGRARPSPRTSFVQGPAS
jgi:hypothetical protein